MFQLCLALSALATVHGAQCMDNQKCSSCESSVGICTTKCYNGFYGLQCKFSCSAGCLNNSCVYAGSGIDECTDGCKAGYYGRRCTIPCDKPKESCMKCPSDCERDFCKIGTSCVSGCIDSYYGPDCLSCPSGCKVCNRITGTCAECSNCDGDCTHGCQTGCHKGFYGEFCEHRCSQNCASVCDNVSGHCLNCTPGWFGSSCETPCSAGCKNTDCDRSGSCVYGCNDGRYGDTCNNTCSSECVDRRCLRNGSCVNECSPGFYGEYCQYCPRNCLNNTCYYEDGSCSACRKGFHGDDCNKSCGRCVDGDCVQETGFCVKGCVSNYRGDNCQHDCSLNCSNLVCQGVGDCQVIPDIITQTNIFLPYWIAGALVIVIIVLVVYMSCRFKRLQGMIYDGFKYPRRGQSLNRNPEETVYSRHVNSYYELRENEMTLPVPPPRRCEAQRDEEKRVILPQNMDIDEVDIHVEEGAEAQNLVLSRRICLDSDERIEKSNLDAQLSGGERSSKTCKRNSENRASYMDVTSSRDEILEAPVDCSDGPETETGTAQLNEIVFPVIADIFEQSVLGDEIDKESPRNPEAVNYSKLFNSNYEGK